MYRDFKNSQESPKKNQEMHLENIVKGIIFSFFHMKRINCCTKFYQRNLVFHLSM